ncbi:MAG: nicotinamide mononucleotide transporter [Thiotrichales bacterium]|nr:MAG: nicotinamide mononucleotide transporter [Thiotrichales bacterium]
MVTTETIINAFLALSGGEVLATILGIAYVILAAKESIWCWPAAFISTLIYTVLFWEGQLPMQAILNFYYMAMAIYGFMLWTKHNKNNETLKVKTWKWPKHLSFILIASILSIGIGYYLTTNSDTRLPYLDATVMVFSVINTWLMAQKILENWIYWIFIDAVAIYLYWQTGFYVTIIMFSLYLVLAIYGYKEWRNSFQKSQGKIKSEATSKAVEKTKNPFI